MSATYTVFGATGYIGSRLVAYLTRDGAPVKQPARDESLSPRVALGHAFYCIGVTGDFRSRPFDAARAHVSRLADILERGSFDSFTYLSSTRIYLGAAQASETAELRVAPYEPDQLYNLTKLAGEALCLNSGKENTRIVRLSNVYGSTPPPNTFLSEIVRSAVERGEVVLRDDLASEKDYVHVDDVVEVVPRIAARGRARIYNVASGVNVSHRALLDVVQHETGCRVQTTPGAPLRHFPVIDITRLRSEFGFSTRDVVAEIPNLVRNLGA